MLLQPKSAAEIVCADLQEEDDVENDVFLKGEVTYAISDDLHVAPATVTTAIYLLQKLGINDADILEERIVDVSRNEVLSLLKSLLLSKTPFTEVFLRKAESMDNCKEDNEILETAQIMSEVKNEDTQAKIISVKLLENKITNKVVRAEAGNDLVDVLLSFLTFPLGSIVKLLNSQSSVGCVDNL
ncbi:uncharacterized protein LOC109846765 [Asparagus officinalis]|nr:uncharacterized protein LOC109846765 [Asparagus officinalis]